MTYKTLETHTKLYNKAVINVINKFPLASYNAMMQEIGELKEIITPRKKNPCEYFDDLMRAIGEEYEALKKLNKEKKNEYK